MRRRRRIGLRGVVRVGEMLIDERRMKCEGCGMERWVVFVGDGWESVEKERCDWDVCFGAECKGVVRKWLVCVELMEVCDE